MKKIIILILVFLMSLFSVNAYVSGFNIIHESTIDGSNNFGCANWSLSGTSIECNEDSGLYVASSAEAETALFVHILPNLSTIDYNFSVKLVLNFSSADPSTTIATFSTQNVSGGNVANKWGIAKESVAPNSNNATLYHTQTGATACDQSGATFYALDGTTQNLTFKFYLNNSLELFINKTQRCYVGDLNSGFTSNEKKTNATFFSFGNSGLNPRVGGLKGFYVWNGTEIIADNSINFSIFDEYTNELLIRNVSVFMIGNNYAVNKSTEKGFVKFNGLTAQDYRVKYSTSGYIDRDYYLSITDGTKDNVKLYLLSTGNSTDVIFTINDESGNPLENAEIQLKKYYIDSNAYVIVAMARTDFEGKAVLDVDFNDAYYEVFATFDSFSVNTVGSKIFATAITITIDTLTDPFAGIDAINRVTSNISFNNLTQTFSFFFSDNDGIVRTGIIEVLRGSEVVCNNTITSASATLLCQYNTTNSTSRILAVGYIDGSKVPISITEVVSRFQRQAKDLFLSSGLFYTILFAGSVAGLGIFSIAVSVILFIVGLGGMIFMGISLVNTTVYILIVIMGMLVVWRVKT